ncbi:MAG: hypothetical protein HYR91_12485 [Flavobacteriia bacterium]|nr:hypothetical protein [Flavobacteriia bacterium]
MSWEDKDIDKLFQEATENQKFEFKDEFWEEMEQMLPQKKSNKKLIYFWWSSLGIVAVSFTAIFLFIPSRNHQINHQNILTHHTKENIKQLSSTLKIEKTIKRTVKNTFESVNTANFNNNKNQINKKRILDNKTTFSSVLDRNQVVINNQENVLEHQLEDFASTSVDCVLPLRYFSNSYQELTFTKQKENLRKNKTNIYFEVGYLKGQSPIISTEKGSNFTDAFAFGVGLVKSKSKWNYSFGVNLLTQSYSNLYINDRAKVYGFGVQNFEKNVDYKHLYQIDFPLYLDYKINKNIFNLGFSSSVLLSSKVNYELLMDKKIQEKESVYGYNEGLRKLNFKVSIRYAYHLNYNFQIGLGLQYQLLSSLNENVFTGIENHHPVNAQIFIKRTLR